jgi:uncharacterized protein YkwD
MIVGFVCTQFADAQQQQPASLGQATAMPQVARLVEDDANVFRRGNGLATVNRNAHLSGAAEQYAMLLAQSDKLSHTADDRQPVDRARAAGYDDCLVAENIAVEWSSAGLADADLAARYLHGWEHSPEHRRNLLDADVVDTGVGVARSDTTGRYYAVQMFGRPKSMAIEFQIVNRTAAPVDYRIGDRQFTLPAGYTERHLECRPGDVVFGSPGEANATTVHATGGERFVVAQDANRRIVIHR